MSAPKPLKAYAIMSPIAGGIISYGIASSPSLVRKAAVRIATVYGGKAPGEDWQDCYRRGYRVVPVMVIPIASTKKARALRSGESKP